MKIAIDISPLQTGHKIRGVGFYLENLKAALLEYFPENEYVFFEAGQPIPKNVDLVHFPYFEPFFLALPIYKRYKTVVTIHDLTPIVFKELFPRGFKGELKWQMQKFSLKKTRRIITDSSNSKEDIIKFAKIKEAKIDVVYLASGKQFRNLNLSKEEKDKIKKKFNLPDKFVLYVGDVTANKNLPRLINAVNAAQVNLVMVGKSLVNQDYDKKNPWNHDLNRVHELAKDNPKIFRLGFVDSDDLVNLYNVADIAILPSFYEGFGLPALEAQACGCPVIATAEGSLKEVLGNSVYIVDAFDLRSIAEGIKAVLSDKKLQEELVRRGYANVKKYSWKKTAKETIEVYKKVVG